MIYPKIGSIQVTKSGRSIVYVEPHEGECSKCFTGINLMNSDESVLWLIDNFEYENLFKRPLIRKFMNFRKQEALASIKE